MPYNGSGTYVLPAGNPVVTGSTISATTHNNTYTDIASALSNCITRDGQSAPTANIPMGGFKHTGLAAGTGNGESVRYEQVGDLAIAQTHAAATKATPADADEIPLSDSAAAFALKKLTWANLKTTLSSTFAALSGATFAGGINEARGSVVMNATTMNLWALPNVIDGTGSPVTITAIVNAPQAGSRRTLYPIAGTIITQGATFSVQGGASYTTATGDALVFEAVTISTYNVTIIKSAGTPVVFATLAEVKAGTVTNKPVAPDTMQDAKLQFSTAVASTSGTAIDFTGIPSWAKRVTVNLNNVSTSGTSAPLVQIGTSGGIEATGYLGSGGAIANGATSGVANFTTGFGLANAAVAASAIHGAIILQKISGNSWVASFSIGWSGSTNGALGGGSKTLTGVLDRVRLTTLGGADTFDLGLVNISWE